MQSLTAQHRERFDRQGQGHWALRGEFRPEVLRGRQARPSCLGWAWFETEYQLLGKRNAFQRESEVQSNYELTSSRLLFLVLTNLVLRQLETIDKKIADAHQHLHIRMIPLQTFVGPFWLQLLTEVPHFFRSFAR